MALAQQNALAIRPNNALLPAQQDLQTVTQLARIATESGLAKVSDEVKASFIILKGLELGIPPFTALGGIFITETWNSKANRNDASIGLTVSLMLGLVQGSGSLADIVIPDPGTIQGSATVKVTRKGQTPFSFTFTRDMAVKMGLITKGNWTKMESVMIVNRAISGALRPVFADVLQGLYLVEEINPDVEVSEDSAPIQVITPPAPQLSSSVEPPQNITTMPTTPQNGGEGTPQPHYLTTSAGQQRLRDLFTELNITPEHHAYYLDALKVSKFSEAEPNETDLHATIRELNTAWKAAQPAEPEPQQAEPEPTPPGYVDITEVFPNEVYPRDEQPVTQTTMPEVYSFTQLSVSTFKNKKTGDDDYKLTFRTDATKADGSLIMASTFHYGTYIELGLLSETQLMKKETIDLVGVTGQIEQTKDGKYWNVVHGTVKQDLPF